VLDASAMASFVSIHDWKGNGERERKRECVVVVFLFFAKARGLRRMLEREKGTSSYSRRRERGSLAKCPNGEGNWSECGVKINRIIFSSERSYFP
jgi:hypothetical protein